MVSKFVHMIWGKNANKIIINIFIAYIFKAFSICELLTPLLMLFSKKKKKIKQFSFCFILCFFHNVVRYVRIHCALNIFIFNFWYALSVKIWNFFYSFVYYFFFPSTEFIAFGPILMPNFVRFPAIPRPVWIRRSFLYFFFILLALSWVAVLAKTKPYFFLFSTTFSRTNSSSSAHSYVTK